MILSDKKQEYSFIKPEMLNINEIKDKYGIVSFAYTKEENGTYYVIAVSETLRIPYFKTQLLMDRINFLGVNSLIVPEIFGEVL